MSGEAAYSGPRFVKTAQEIDPSFPDYEDYMSMRRRSGLSTSRRDYFRDIFLGFDDRRRAKIVQRILDDVGNHNPPLADEIRDFMGDRNAVPSAVVPESAWGAERLNDYLTEIDLALGRKNPEHAMTLAYTCMEGFFKAFVRKNIPSQAEENEIVALARVVKRYLKGNFPEYPEDVVNMVPQAANAVNRLRNSFSQSHFGEDADAWAAIYIRDLVNTHIRPLLHFM
jgi:hypothetical protein